jgi:hypothetical protein
MVTKGKPMNKLTIASILLASVGATVVAAPTFAAENDTASETSPSEAQVAEKAIQDGIDAGLSLTDAVKQAIANNPAIIESIVTAGFIAAGTDATLITSISNLAEQSGLTIDLIIGLAAASGSTTALDTVSQATAAGAPADGAPTNPTVININNTSGVGGGGGGVGISEIAL